MFAVQDRFPLEIGISDHSALFDFNLAPLSSRRDMAMLGVIHRATLGLGPEQLQDFFKRDWAVVTTRSRMSQRRHPRQLIGARRPRFSEQFRRSAFGLVAVYNLLPEEVVSMLTVSSFQSRLQSLLRAHARSTSDWSTLFSPRFQLYCHPLLQYI